MAVTFAAAVLSSRDPIAHAGFYRDLLGWRTVAEEPDWVRLASPEQERPSLSFQLEPDDVAPDWPAREGGIQMQVHLDFLVDDLDAETVRAIDLGAELLEHPVPEEGLRVLRDPFGHVFCLFLPES